MASSDFKDYHYDPSTVAAVIFTVLFTLTALFHLYQLFRTRTWYFIPFVTGGCFELVGYTCRIVSSEQTPNWTLVPFIIQTLLLLLAPVLFAASIYMELARIIIVADGQPHALIRPKWLTKTFVSGDVLSFALQAMGGSLMSGGSHNTNSNTTKIGQHLIIGGLFVQLIFFGGFLFVAILFQVHISIRKAPSTQVKSLSAHVPFWRKHLFALYAASVLILIRSTGRVIEFIEGNDGYILGHEWFLYVFDAVLMLAVMVIFNVIHPSEIKALLHGGKVSRGGLRLYTVEAKDDLLASGPPSV